MYPYGNNSIQIPAYEESAMGIIESVHNLIETVLKIRMSEQGNDHCTWDLHLDVYVHFIKKLIRSLMGYSANYIAIGFQIRYIADSQFSMACETPDKITRHRNMQHERQLVGKNFQLDHENLKKFYDRRHQEQEYQVSQLVLVYNSSFQKGHEKTFTSPFQGPGIL